MNPLGLCDVRAPFIVSSECLRNLDRSCFIGAIDNLLWSPLLTAGSQRIALAVASPKYEIIAWDSF
jgi:hypothetical protein